MSDWIANSAGQESQVAAVIVTLPDSSMASRPMALRDPEAMPCSSGLRTSTA